MQRQYKRCCMASWLSSLPFPRPPSLGSVMGRLMVTKRGTSVVFAVRHFPSRKGQGDGSLRLVQTLKSAAFSHNEKKKKCSDKAAAAAFSIPSPQLASWETRPSGFRLFRLCCSAACAAKRSPTSHSDFLPS